MNSSIDDLASQCIRCGFCLESCPTYLETGSETESPRGRIHLMKAAARGQAEWAEIRAPLDRCLGCRACETACPSGVRYGGILEEARSRLGPSQEQRRALALTTRPLLLRMALFLGRICGVKRVPGTNQPLPSPQRLSIRPLERLTAGPEVALLKGCAMQVLFPNVHVATENLLTRAGFQVIDRQFGCCGALHAHNGDIDRGRQMAERLREHADAIQLCVNSAGCGAWLKECGVPAQDISQLLGSLDLSQARWTGVVTYHDACHLAHGQGIRIEPRNLIKSISGVRFVELTEADHCCGSAGIYSMLQPEMATRLVQRKWANLERSLAGSKAGENPPTVVLGNPGCHTWIASSSPKGSAVQVLHLAEFLEQALARES